MKRDEERFEEVVGGGAENAAGHHPEHLVVDQDDHLKPKSCHSPVRGKRGEVRGGV